MFAPNPDGGGQAFVAPGAFLWYTFCKTIFMGGTCRYEPKDHPNHHRDTEWRHFTLVDEPYPDAYFTFPVSEDAVSQPQ